MTTMLKALVLLGIAHLCMASCNIDSFFKVDIDISLTNEEFDLTSCDSNKAKTNLHKLIQKQVGKKFDEYFAATRELKAMDVEELCGGVDEDGENRALAFATTKNAWYYSSTAKCRFCLPDDTGASTGGNSTSVPRADISQSQGLRSGPSTRDRNFGVAERANAERALRITLQTKLHEALTRKVNKNKRMSCLVGSDSEVDVTLTPTGNRHPQVVCPP